MNKKSLKQRSLQGKKGDSYPLKISISKKSLPKSLKRRIIPLRDLDMLKETTIALPSNLIEKNSLITLKKAEIRKKAR